MEYESNGILTVMWMDRMYTMGKKLEMLTNHALLIPIYSVEVSKERPLRVDYHRSKLLPFDYNYEPGKESPLDYYSRYPPAFKEFTQ